MLAIMQVLVKHHVGIGVHERKKKKGAMEKAHQTLNPELNDPCYCRVLFRNPHDFVDQHNQRLEAFVQSPFHLETGFNTYC